MKSVMVKKYFALPLQTLALFVLIAIGLTSCSPSIQGYYYLVAKKTESSPELRLVITLIRKFEKENWCNAEKENFTKREFEAECRYEDLTYESMFRGEAVGEWYVLQRIGRFPPSIIMYQFDPPLPEPVVLEQLKRTAPHILKFAAIHRAPAEARIFSPAGEVL